MFITYPVFEHPLQLDQLSTTWYAVELALHMPLFLVTTTSHEADAPRVFLLHGTNELLVFAKDRPAGEITELHLLEPPLWSGDGEWSIKRMCEILLQESPPDGSKPSAIARAADGTLYGGFPIAPVEGDPGPLSMLASCARSTGG